MVNFAKTLVQEWDNKKNIQRDRNVMSRGVMVK